MKKIIGIVLASAMIASSFAVDFTARAMIEGSIAGSTEKEYKSGNDWLQSDSAYMLKLNDSNVQDNDLLQAAISGDNFGASFRLYGKVSEDTLKLRKLALWFKPVDSIKITLGNGGYGLYTEKIDYWKVPTGISYLSFSTGAETKYQSSSILTGGIIGAEFTGIEGLWVAGGVGPGAGNTWLSDTTTSAGASKTITETKVQWGIGAKKTFEDTPYSIGIGYNDNGYGERKMLTLGADYTSENFYGFIQTKFDISNIIVAYKNGEYTAAMATVNNNAENKLSAPVYDKSGSYAVRGMTLDNYFMYDIGALKVEATLPYTFRYSKSTLDPNYMTARVKVTIPVDSLNVMCIVGSGDRGWICSDEFGKYFTFYAKPYVGFNIGSCAMELGFEFNFQQDTWKSSTVTWGIPFKASISF